MSQRARTLLVALLVVVAVVMRLVPHHANMAALGATCLIAGIYLTGYKSFILPLAAIIISDFFVGFYSWPIMLVVWASYLPLIGLGKLVDRSKAARGRVGYGLLGALTGSVIFYLTTNTAVWAFGKMYQPTWHGLTQSLINGLPFFRNSLTSDLAYSVIFILVVEAVMVTVKLANFQTKTKHATLGSDGRQ